MNSTLRALVDLRDRQIQKGRIAFSNRVSAVERGQDESDPQQVEVIQKYLDMFNDLEKQLDKDIALLVKEEAIYEPLVGLRGIGPMFAAKLVALVDIERSPTVQSLWRYAGLAAVHDTILSCSHEIEDLRLRRITPDRAGPLTVGEIVVCPTCQAQVTIASVSAGRRERPIAGEKLHYNARLKTLLYLIAGSFIKSGSPYRRIYDEAKVSYAKTHPEWTLLHRHYASLRKMEQIFLSHLHMTWRTLEGLPAPEPYVSAYMGHTIYQPEEFGWKLTNEEKVA